MKNQSFFLLLLVAVIFSTTACETMCDGEGSLTLNNESNTPKQVTINNISYGILSPGDKEEYKLPEGTYVVEWDGVGGGPGCNPFTVNIVECNTQGYKCTY